jgi:hypothetical protein
MGNSSSNGNLGESLSFTCDKIGESANKRVLGVYIDDSLLPNAGIVVVGMECNIDFSL